MARTRVPEVTMAETRYFLSEDSRNSLLSKKRWLQLVTSEVTMAEIRNFLSNDGRNSLLPK